MSSSIPVGAEKLMPKTIAVDFTAPINTSELNGKSVLVTGGASGLGRASVETFAAAGAFVTIADLQEEAALEITKDLTSRGYKVQFAKTDVTDYESQTAAFKSAVEFGGGKLDIVVPSAGIDGSKNLFDMVADIEPSLDTAPPVPGFSTVDVNLKGVYYSCYLAIYYFRISAPVDSPPFKKAIVLLSSVAGYEGYSSNTAYTMSKFGVRGMLYGLRAKASEQSPQVRINLVAPWFVKTPMTIDPKKQGTEAAIRAELVYGYAPIEKVVDAVVRLSVNEDITGRAVIVLPEGNVDLEDDFWGGYGGVVFQQQMGMTLERVMKAMAELQKGSA